MRLCAYYVPLESGVQRLDHLQVHYCRYVVASSRKVRRVTGIVSYHNSPPYRSKKEIWQLKFGQLIIV
jgi:hypothetical protein